MKSLISPSETKNKLLLPSEVAARAREIKGSGKTIATLNGSFDLLHVGHLFILEEAAAQADILIVGLNTDASIGAYKSKDRPIVPLENRLKMIAALECVDHVTYFDETTPHTFIKAVHPDVHINGSEYGKACIEADLVRQLGAKLHIVELVPGFSTSDLIKRIKACD